MKEIKITCDHCNRDLTTTGSMPDYRICLSAESMPHDTNVIYSVMVYPPFDRDKFFCGLECLKKWLLKEE